jgi:hypothetical protein
LFDPELVKLSWNTAQQGVGSFLMTKMEIFLLALCQEAPRRHNIDYIWQLDEYYRKTISSGFTSDWFKKQFPFCGLFWKANLIPLDKFKRRNIFGSYKTKKVWIFYLTTPNGIFSTKNAS